MFFQKLYKPLFINVFSGVVLLPVVYKCSGCGRVLYYEEWGRIKSPLDVVWAISRCPGCGRSLGERVEVRVVGKVR